MAEDQTTKPKVTLDDILKSATAYRTTSQLAERQTSAEDLQNFYAYLQAKGKDPSEIPQIADLEANAQFSRMLGFTANQERKDLAAKTETALKDVVGKLTEDVTFKLSFKYGGAKDKDYGFYSEAVRNEDAGAVKAMYMAKYKDDPLLMGYAMMATEAQFLRYANVQLGKIQSNFAEKNLYSEKVGKDGKKTKEYDAKKAQAYLITALSGLKGADREAALVEVGSIGAQLYAAEKEKKAKEAAATAGKK